MAVESQRVQDFKLEKEPYYLPVGNEIELYEAAYHAGLPVMLKGPTGCGKTRFVEHMAARLAVSGLPELIAARAAIVDALTDDADTAEALNEVVLAAFAED